jgi:hypothetical protein
MGFLSIRINDFSVMFEMVDAIKGALSLILMQLSEYVVDGQPFQGDLRCRLPVVNGCRNPG